MSGSLNTLLKYRFVKKPSAKLDHSDAITTSNGLLRDSSVSSVDSQATIPYNSDQSLSETQASEDSQATILQSQASLPVTDSQCTLPPDHMNDSNKVLNRPPSPVFTSKTNSNHRQIVIIEETSPKTASPGFGPWMSKQSGPEGMPGMKNPMEKEGNKFRRVKRPEPDSDDEAASPPQLPTSPASSVCAPTKAGVPLKVNEQYLHRLKELFPDGSEARMRAALIVYPRDLNKAINFMISDPEGKTKLKRPAPDLSSNEGQEPDAKRVKVVKDHFSGKTTYIVTSPSSVSNGLKFLQSCFPGKSMEDLRKALDANNGDASRAVTALATENRSKSNSVTTPYQNGAGPSTTDVVKPTSVLKSQVTTTAAAGKVKPKKKEMDLSDEDDDYEDEYNSGDSDDSEDLDNRSKTETDSFLQFFEEATIEELTALPGCSKKKAEVIINLRPFSNWETLYEKFSSEKQLSTSIISGCKEIMQVRNTVRRLMVRCENISQQMGRVVARINGSEPGQGGGDSASIMKQPELLSKDLVLQPYQLVGLSWLRIMHEQELNGILADEMGLGKTIQAIAFIAHLLEDGEEGPHVIIVPSSTIENWLRELQRWCPTLKVIVYYGSQEERRAVRHSIFFQGEEFHVLLTTYNMATGGVEDRVLFKKFDFHYAVFDEGHMLKNMSSLRFQNLMKIAAERRLLLTGTPLQNNLLELMSLLCFVMPEIFQGKTEPLKKVFAMISRSDDKQKSRFEKDRIAQAKRIMKPFVLRRLKRDVLKQLPQKTEHIERCPLTAVQQELYESLVNKYSQEVQEGEETTTAGGVGIFMQFRKAANHPLLLRNHYSSNMLKKMAKSIAKEPSHRDRGALPKLIEEDMCVMSDFELLHLCRQYKKYLGKFELDNTIIAESAKFQVLDRLLPDMKEKGDRVLLFSQFTMMLDIMEEYLKQRDHKYIRMDGQTPVPDRLQLIDRFNNEQDIFIFLLSTRAGGVGINLAAANTIILHDIDFNPYNDKQAEDRCHRLGQKREVNVYKIICEDTVDEAMLRCANEKLALEKDLTASHNEENEENAKDVANLLKEVLRSRQKKKEGADSSLDSSL